MNENKQNDNTLENEKSKLLEHAFNNLTKEEQELIKISAVIGEQTDNLADKQEFELEINTETNAN